MGETHLRGKKIILHTIVADDSLRCRGISSHEGMRYSRRLFEFQQQKRLNILYKSCLRSFKYIFNRGKAYESDVSNISVLWSRGHWVHQFSSITPTLDVCCQCLPLGLLWALGASHYFPLNKLDESTARQHLKSPGHYLVVYTWPSDHFRLRYSKFHIQGQGHGQGQTWWSPLRPKVQAICLLFVSWQWDHFWLRYSKFLIRPWEFKVNVMAKVKSDCHIWGPKFYRYIFFSFAIGPFLVAI